MFGQLFASGCKRCVNIISRGGWECGGCVGVQGNNHNEVRESVNMRGKSVGGGEREKVQREGEFETGFVFSSSQRNVVILWRDDRLKNGEEIVIWKASQK